MGPKFLIWQCHFLKPVSLPFRKCILMYIYHYLLKQQLSFRKVGIAKSKFCKKNVDSKGLIIRFCADNIKKSNLEVKIDDED